MFFVLMKVKLLILLVIASFFAYSQQGGGYPCYPLPVKYEIDLSATFGELRNNAFHAGVDIKTGGKEGLCCCRRLCEQDRCVSIRIWKSGVYHS